MKKQKRAKRKTTKKAQKSVKKRARPTVHVTISRKMLGKAPEQYHFHLKDGRSLESVYELIDELETMSEETFREYADDFENHFANWIDHVFEEKSLADEIRHIRNKLDMQRSLLKHLVKELLKEHGTKQRT